MKSIKSIASAILTAGILSVTAFAGPSATQTVTYEVSPINELSVSSPTVSLTINSATAGSAPDSATNSATTYAITTNETGRVITGSIDEDMPANVTLSLGLTAPTGASSNGPVALSTLAQELVTGISTLNEAGLGISYELSATSAAGVVPSASRTVTLTITAAGV